MATIALPTEIQYEAARAYVAQKPAPAGVSITIEKNEARLVSSFDELSAEGREWVYGLLDAADAVASDEALMKAHAARKTTKKSWFASIMASFGI